MKYKLGMDTVATLYSPLYSIDHQNGEIVVFSIFQKWYFKVRYSGTLWN
uniref:Uncharacterized protein n=1 Tax=Anguilla anguilla TaxID=7936 RepID=A0A0E9S272_ANGAN